MKAKTLEELIGLDTCRQILDRLEMLAKEQVEPALKAYAYNPKYYSVGTKLPENNQQIFCIFPPTLDGFKAKFCMEIHDGVDSWVVYPETGGFLCEEEDLVWCELNSEGEWEV